MKMYLIIIALLFILSSTVRCVDNLEYNNDKRDMIEKSIVVLGGRENFFFNASTTFTNNNYIASIPPIVFIKTHKTGSSTLTSLLDRLADIRNLFKILPSSGGKLGWPGEFPGLIYNSNNIKPHSIDIINNHAILDVEKMNTYMKPNPFYLTILREPFSQSISAYNFFRSTTIKQGKSYEDTLNWIDNMKIVGDKGSSRFRNPAATDLGWYFRSDIHFSTNYDNDNNKIQSFINYIDNNFDLVLITEYFDQGLVLLSYLLGITIEEMIYVRLNEADKSHPDYVIPDDSYKDKLYKVNNVDAQLYTYFSNKFNNIWQEYSNKVKVENAIDPSVELLETRLAKLQSHNEAIDSICDVDITDSRCSLAYMTTNDDYIDYFKRKPQLIAQQKNNQDAKLPTPFTRPSFSPTIKPTVARSEQASKLGLVRKSTNVLGGFDNFYYKASNEFLSSEYLPQLPPTVFIKVHKTGGSTITSIFDRMADVRNLEVMHPVTQYQLGWPGEFPGNVNYQPHSLDMIIDRAVLNVEKMNSYLKISNSNNFYFTILNDPFNQTMQAYNDFVVDGKRYGVTFDQQLDWIASVIDVGHDKKTARFRNPMATDLGWYFYNNNKGSTINDYNNNMIETFIKYIDDTMNLVIITEHFDKGMVLLSYMLNISIEELYYVRNNVKVKNDYTYPDEKLRSKLYSINNVDYQLYSYFTNKFNKVWEEACKQVATAKIRDHRIELLEDKLIRLQTINNELQNMCALDKDKNIDNSKCSKSYVVENHEYTDYLRTKNNNKFLRYR